MAKITKTFQYGKHTVTLETGEVARQASGAVIVKMDDTVLLVTAVAAKSAREGQDFFPLTVDYQEKFYAGGRIPGGFFKREGRATEKETLISRLIDRPIRPLFPEEYKNEVQIIATVMSLNPEIDGDIPALIGASAALSLAGTPFKGPIGAAKVGYKNGEYILNPTVSELADSQLELVVAGTSNAVLMVESEAALLSEEVMLGAVTFGHREMQKVINAINELTVEAGTKPSTWEAPAKNDALISALKEAIGPRLGEAFQVRDKLQRRDAISAIKKDVFEALAGRVAAEGRGAGGRGGIARARIAAAGPRRTGPGQSIRHRQGEEEAGKGGGQEARADLSETGHAAMHRGSGALRRGDNENVTRPRGAGRGAGEGPGARRWHPGPPPSGEAQRK
mgnify:CR=1 FL=1